MSLLQLLLVLMCLLGLLLLLFLFRLLGLICPRLLLLCAASSLSSPSVSSSSLFSSPSVAFAVTHIHLLLRLMLCLIHHSVVLWFAVSYTLCFLLVSLLLMFRLLLVPLVRLLRLPPISACSSFLAATSVLSCFVLQRRILLLLPIWCCS